MLRKLNLNVKRERKKQKTKPTQHGCYINSMWPIKIIFLLAVREILCLLELMFFSQHYPHWGSNADVSFKRSLWSYRFSFLFVFLLDCMAFKSSMNDNYLETIPLLERCIYFYLSSCSLWNWSVRYIGDAMRVTHEYT